MRVTILAVGATACGSSTPSPAPQGQAPIQSSPAAPASGTDEQAEVGTMQPAAQGVLVFD